MNDSVEASAHLKVILLGEHAVVFGAHALAMGAGEAAVATARWASEARLQLGERVFDAKRREAPEWQAWKALRSSLGVGLVDARVELRVPAGVGLGASAAVAVALGRACLRLARLEGTGAERARVLRAAAEWEGVFHGNPSGVDAVAALSEGVVRYSRQTGAESVRLTGPLHWLVCRTGPAASTRQMVEQVAGLRATQPRARRALQEIAALVPPAVEALAGDNPDELGRLMNGNHELLASLGLSTPQLDRARQAALAAGVFGAKLTGAGGGGCLVAVGTPAALARTQADLAGQQLWCLSGCTDSGGAPPLEEPGD